MVRLTDRPDMTLDVNRGRKTTTQQQQQGFWNACGLKHCFARKRNGDMFVFLSYSGTYNIDLTEIIRINKPHRLNMFSMIFFNEFHFLAFLE